MSDARGWSTEAREHRALRALQRVRLFRGLPDAMMAEAAEFMREVRFERGAAVFRQGRRMHEAFYILLSGRVRQLQTDQPRPDRILSYHGPGDVLGESQLLTGGTAPTTAEAVLDTVALALPFRAFRDLLDHHPAAALPLARLLGRRIGAITSRRGRRRTSVFLGVQAGGLSPRSSLLTLGVARGLIGVTGSTVLVLDFAYGGPVPRGGGPGVVRAVEEVLDARGHVRAELLRQRVQRVDDSLSYLLFALPTGGLDDCPLDVFPELLGEAKRLASYVLVRVPPKLGRGAAKLVSQLEHVVVGVTPEEVEGGQARDVVGSLGGITSTVGLLTGSSEDAGSSSDFHRATGRERAFVFPCREVAERSLLRLSPYPREAIEEGEEAAVQARTVVRRVTRRRVGLCLGSGTALGWAHIGVLQVLAREKLPVDCISGSSMGSILASMFAAGFTVERMYEIATGVTEAVVNGWSDYNWPVMRDGLVRGEVVTSFLTEIFGDLRIEDTEIPLVIQATDLMTGLPFYFRQGPVVEAVRASISLPGVFRPVEIAGHLLVDGGVHDTLPTTPLRSLGGDLVIAVNTTQSPEFNQINLKEAKGYNVFDIFLRSLEIMQTRRTGFEGMAADLVIQPEIQGPSWRELWRAEEIIPFGVTAAEQALDDIYAMLRRPPV